MSTTHLSSTEIQTLLQANNTTDLQSFDLLTNQGVQELNWDKFDPVANLDSVRAYQRLSAVHSDPKVAESLLNDGFASANDVAKVPREVFVAEHSIKLGLAPDQARALHERATGVRNKTLHLWASVRGTVASPFFRASRIDSVSDEIKQTFADLPSYQELFGSLDYCGCEECHSIFGPAAYLVDLLRIIDEYVTKPNAQRIDPKLLFEARRPDISQINLTCANTFTLVPYLQIVNERLLANAATFLKQDPSSVTELMATTLIYPKELPFNAPLDQIRVLLDKVGVSLGSILSAWKVQPATVAARSLGLSPEQEAIVTTPLTTADKIAPYYNVTSDTINTLNDVDTFLGKTWTTFAELLELINQDLSVAEQTSGLQVNFFINQGLNGKWLTLNQDEKTGIYGLTNLELVTLDRINRLTRLARIVGRSVQDVDWALHCIQKGAILEIGGSLEPLLTLMRVGKELSLDFVSATALLGPIKTYGEGEDGAGTQFDRLFNSTALVAKQGVYHPLSNPLNATYQTQPLSWTPGSTNDLAAISRVLPGLGISLNAVNTLGTFLYQTTEQKLAIDVLSALYRHAVLSRALEMPMDQYVVFLRLVGLADPKVPTADELFGILAANQWLNDTDVTVFQLDYVINGTTSVSVDEMYVPATVDQWLSGLRSSVDPIPMTSPPTLLPLVSPQTTVGAKIATQTGVLFGTTNALIDAILPMAIAGVPLPAGVSSWEAAFLGLDASNQPYSNYVNNVLARISRWLVLAQMLNLADETVGSIHAFPAAYGLPTTFDPIFWNIIKNISQVQSMMNRFGDQQKNLLVYIRLVSSGSDSDGALKALQKATGWSPEQVTTLLAGPAQEPTISEQLAALEKVFDLMSALGSDVSLMATIAFLADRPATEWTRYLQTAALVLTKTASRYGDQWTKIWEALSGELNVHLRDALLALGLTQLNTQYPVIKTPQNVYEFLLTDVEMGPTTDISYVKEALNAAQLYLQRCRLRLEPGVDDLTGIEPTWWEWMMNYRIWEANREIFVYPENYLLPTLRKTVTPPFAKFSDALQQQDIGKSYVESTFRTYIDDFAAVAQLRTVDCHRARVNETDTTYVLARSRTSPYTFYYCSQPDGMPWTPWTKIDLTIHSAHCTILYAFNRLFLFWIEFKKHNSSSIGSTGGGINTTSNTTYTVSVLYSFINQQGTWVQPQTLVDNAIALFEGDPGLQNELKNDQIFEGLFEMDDPVWKKVYALYIRANNYDPPRPNPGESDRIVVMYGPLLKNSVQVISDQSTPPTDPNAAAFWRNLHERVEDHQRLITGQLSGNVPLQPVSVLNASLENDVLVHNQELLLLDPHQRIPPLSEIRAEFQGSGAVLQVSHSAEPLSDNRVSRKSHSIPGATLSSNSFVGEGVSLAQSTEIFKVLQQFGFIDKNNNVNSENPKAALDLYGMLEDLTGFNNFGQPQYSWVQEVLFDFMDSTALFSNLSGVQASVMPVSAQPGSFIFSANEETFLLSPRQLTGDGPVFSSFAEGLRVVAPPLLPTFAIMLGDGQTQIDAKTSAALLFALEQAKLVVNDQLVRTTEAEVTNKLVDAIEQGRLQITVPISYWYHALSNAPILFQDAFDRIDSTKSQNIYQAFRQSVIVDPNGRIDESQLAEATIAAALEKGQVTLTRSQMVNAYLILARAPKTIGLSYTNHANTPRFRKLVFEMSRLSTGGVKKLYRSLAEGGVDALFSTSTQELPVFSVLPLSRFGPSRTNLDWPDTFDATEVDFEGLYGQYYWEIFYHIPMLVAYTLSTNQCFQQAMSWLQYVFNPTLPPPHPVTADTFVNESQNSISPAQAAQIVSMLQSPNNGRPAAPILNSKGEVNPKFGPHTDIQFLRDVTPQPIDHGVVRRILLNHQRNAPASNAWQFRPFRNHTLQTLQQTLSDQNAAVKVYNDDPFDPFAIARLRMGAFEKATVIQYVDNLIAWGDQLFTQDTWESIDAAYMLYVYAYNLLGPKPEQVGECRGKNLVLNYAQIKQAYPTGVPQFLIDLENFVAKTGKGADVQMLNHGFNDLYVYFCVPENANLVQRWDTIQDRMFKIDQSMNIQGVVRTLPLFQPPINPLDLIRAGAAGNNVQPTQSAPTQLSPWRYSSAYSTAQSLCATLIDVGNSILAVLEKKDAEGLSSLRANQEGQLLHLMTQIKEDRVTELQATIRGLTAAQNGAQQRLDFYTNALAKGLSGFETTSLNAAEAATILKTVSGLLKGVASIGFETPQAGSPFALTYGGYQLGNALATAAEVIEIGSTVSDAISVRAATMATYDRRNDDWTLQQSIAQSDVDSFTEQLNTLTAQLQSARRELQVHQQQITQSKAVESYLKSKFTNKELYQWMVGRFGTVYFQTYALTLQAARQAEAAYQFETDSDRTFLTFDYWDSLHKGLTAGEGLRLALNRLDDAYRAGNTRRLEVERVVSLAMICPDQLLKLKTTGKCDFKLTEALFDYDYPGQYARKIKTITLSIPAVVGPYQNINATLTQTSNCVVTKPNSEVVKYLLGILTTAPKNSDLRQNCAQNQSIAISRGIDDAGMFVLDFNDPRYLPFENTGAVSDWTLSMPLETNRFDFQSISDVIIAVRYTALYDTTLEHDLRTGPLKQAPLFGGLYIDARFQSAAWQQFLTNHTDKTKQTLKLNIDPAQFGFFKELTYTSICVALKAAENVTLDTSSIAISVKSGSAVQALTLTNGLGTAALMLNGKNLQSVWEFDFALNDQRNPLLSEEGFIDGTKLLDMQVVLLYKATVF